MSEEQQNIVFCGVLTVSSRCAEGIMEDKSGPNLQKLLQEYSGFKAIVKVRKIVPDNILAIKSTLVDWVDNENCDIILTTGGTGIAPSDVTPEATLQVIKREIQAVVTGIIGASLAATRFSMLSRMVCGTRGKCFILNLPGSKLVAEDCFKFISPILEHVVNIMAKDIDDISVFYKIAGNIDSRPPRNEGQDPSSSSSVPNQVSQVSAANPTSNVSIDTPHGISQITPGLAHGAVHGLVPGAAQHGLIHGAVHGLAPGIGYGHGETHGPTRGDVHGLDHGIGHGQGIEAGDNDISRIITLSDVELDLDTAELERRIALPDTVTSNDTSSLLPKPRNVSIKKLVAEKRKLNPEYIRFPTKIPRLNQTSKYPLTPVDKAISIIMEKTPVLPVITKSYEDAMGYVLARDIQSPEPLPAFAASIKDGYAVIASDTPGVLKIIGSSVGGELEPTAPLQKGQAIRITTGSPIPAGADAVVQVEDTKLTEEANQGELEVKISVTTKAEVGQDIRKLGSDIGRRDLVLPAGILLGECEIGVLASIGVTEIPVYKKPVVAVVSNGNELTEPENANLRKGQVRDCNRITLLSALKENGFSVIDAGIAPDNLGKLQLTIETALDRADVIISTGGASTGERDFMKSAIECLGGTIHFGQVLMTPGKSTTFATANSTKGKKVFFALPGDPVSTVVTFNLFGLRALKKMSGCSNSGLTTIKARVSSEIKLDARPEYKRCTVSWKTGDATPWVKSTGNQINRKPSSLAKSNALLVLPPREEDRTEIVRGELVDVLLIDKL